MTFITNHWKVILSILVGSVFISLGTLYVATAEKRIVISSKPIDIPMHTHLPQDTHYDHMEWSKGTVTVPEDMWLTGISTRVENAPHEALHAVYLTLEDEQDATCPDNPRFLWSGSTVTTRQQRNFEPPYGIFVKKGDVLTIEASFHNGNPEAAGETFFSVNTTLELTYELAKTSERTVPVLHAIVNVAGCDYHRPVLTILPYAKDVAYDSLKLPLVFPADAEITRARAHFHSAFDDTSTKNSLELFLDDELIEQHITQDTERDVQRNPLLLTEKLPLSVSKGQRFWLRAYFNNPSSTPVYGAMAMIGVYYSLK